MNKKLMNSMMVACVAVFALSSQAKALSVNVSLGCAGVQVSVVDNKCKQVRHDMHDRRHREELARLEAARRHREEMARREAARRHKHHNSFSRR